MFTGFDDLQKVGRENFEVAVKSADAVTKGLGLLAARTAEYARHSLESGAKALEQLVGAPSLDEAVEVQSAYLRGAYEGYVTQATKVGEIVTAMARDAYKPYEGLLGRVTR
ncbi:MAG TPA: phasin family protein [Bauldia sp.]|nr:phasin family protein [Bauldia sp.]